jgi:hypothetical protein
MTSTQAANARRRRRWSIESVAGWVFADLFLVLFLVGLGSAVPIKPAVKPTPKPPATAKPTPKPTPTPPAPIIGMKQIPIPLNLTVAADALTSTGPAGTREGGLACRRLRQAAAVPLKGERAGLVLIFGGGADVVHGQAVARSVAKQLPCANPALFSRSTPYRAFWDGTLDYGRVRLEVFVFTTKKTK